MNSTEIWTFKRTLGNCWQSNYFFHDGKTSLRSRIKISSGKKQTAYDMWGYMLIRMPGYRGKKLQRINKWPETYQNPHQIHICFDKLIAMISPWLEWPIKREIPPPCMIRKMTYPYVIFLEDLELSLNPSNMVEHVWLLKLLREFFIPISIPWTVFLMSNLQRSAGSKEEIGSSLCCRILMECRGRRLSSSFGSKEPPLETI